MIALPVAPRAMTVTVDLARPALKFMPGMLHIAARRRASPGHGGPDLRYSNRAVNHPRARLIMASRGWHRAAESSILSDSDLNAPCGPRGLRDSGDRDNFKMI